MKVLLIVTLVALATGQQLQQSSNSRTAVVLARPGYFQQVGSSSLSSSGNNNQFQSNSFQNNNFRNENANFRSGSSAGRISSSQPGSLQNQNQFQFNSNSNRNQFQQRESILENDRFKNNQVNRFQSRSGIQNQLQDRSADSFQPSNQNRFESESFHQNQNRFQPTSFQSDSFQRQQNKFQSGSFQPNQNNFQSGSLQQDQNQFQSGSFQQRQNRGPSNSLQNNQNRFQSSLNQQDNQNRRQSFDENQSRNNQQFQRTDSTNFQSNNFQQRDRNLKQQSQFQSRSLETSNDFSEGIFEPLNLPSGASYLLGDISTSFSCTNRPYGYYADQDNSCRVFHVCNPSLFSDGQIQTYQYSFMCGEGTVFDQKELTCLKELEASPCQEALSYYSKNEEFGRPEEKF